MSFLKGDMALYITTLILLSLYLYIFPIYRSEGRGEILELVKFSASNDLNQLEAVLQLEEH